MPQTHYPAAGLLFIFLLIWLLFPEGEYQNQSLALSDLAARRLARYRDALVVLNKTHWGEFNPYQTENSDDDRPPEYVNLTGFREEDGLAWEDLRRFKELGLQLSRHAIPSLADKQLWDLGEAEALWVNASGTLYGEWVRRPGSQFRSYDSYNLSRSVPSMDWVGDRAEWARNMTGESGRLLLRLEGDKIVTEYEDRVVDDSPLSGRLIRNIRGTATVEDTAGSGLNWEMRLWGIHWPRQGVIIMTTTSEKFEGIFGLPHLTPSADFFQSSQRLLNRTLASVVSRKEKNIYVDQSMPWNSDVENPLYTAYPSPHCEYIMYAQVYPPSPHSPPWQSLGSAAEDMDRAMRDIESELEDPRGAPIRSIPSLHMSAVMYSPDCAFFLETKGPPQYSPSQADHLVGKKTEVHVHQIKTWMLLYALIAFGQVGLLKNQMMDSFTPSTMGRISFWTIGIMVLVDGMTFSAAATWVSSAAATFLPTLALMFASFMSATIGGSFLAKIHEVQLPESRQRRQQDLGRDHDTDRDDRTRNSHSAGQSAHRTGPILPGPATAGPSPGVSSSPFDIVAAEQEEGVEAAGNQSAAGSRTDSASLRRSQGLPFQTIIGRLILLGLCISFAALSSATWYPRARFLFLNLCAFSYLSLWVPQIYRNMRRNCRRALSWQFVVGQSILRLLPIAYFWVKEDNFLYARTDRPTFALLCAWLWLQIFVLASQEVVGPRFAVPDGWMPEVWDYHPLLREDKIESGGLPIGLVSDDARALDRGTGADKGDGSLRAIDCAICRELLEVHVIRTGQEESSVTGVFARRFYMVTPCRHIFHTTCLEGWMRFRLQCPICREELPPI